MNSLGGNHKIETLLSQIGEAEDPIALARQASGPVLQEASRYLSPGNRKQRALLSLPSAPKFIYLNDAIQFDANIMVDRIISAFLGAGYDFRLCSHSGAFTLVVSSNEGLESHGLPSIVPYEFAHDLNLIAFPAAIFEAIWKRGFEPRKLFASAEVADLPLLVPTWDNLIQILSREPEEVYNLSDRKFEELIAELLNRDGFDVKLTPQKKDGGFDILAWDTRLGRHLYLVECKRFARRRPVGVEIVRALYGVVEQMNSAAGILVTTSSFTRGSRDFAKSLEYRMSLRDFESLTGWLRRLAGEHLSTGVRADG